ncbi:unnamed protein product [Cuscuta campestris]|uniref:Uncharacterized protein n=1 Tax=Cuscuta campestris TaxID=132261 RepID=A0A484NPN7_9ASTE|nr:unnamed protein product [Cuscuta campestris]
MDSHDYFLDPIIPETEFQDCWGEVEDLISDDSEVEEVIVIHSGDEVIVIDSEDDGADPAPIREMQCFINIQSQEDCIFVDGRQEGDEMEEFERAGPPRSAVSSKTEENEEHRCKDSNPKKMKSIPKKRARTAAWRNVQGQQPEESSRTAARRNVQG